MRNLKIYDVHKGRAVRCAGVKAVFSEALLPYAEQIIRGADDMVNGGKRLKIDTTSDVSLANIGGFRFIIKRYNNKGLLHTIRQNFKPSRAKKCWNWGNRLLDMGIDTAKPLGYMELYCRGLRRKAYLFTEYLEGAYFTLALKTAAGKEQADEISAAVNSLVCRLEDSAIVHSDLKPPNIIISAARPYLIDLDSMRKTNLLTIFYDKGKDRRHLIKKLLRENVRVDEYLKWKDPARL